MCVSKAKYLVKIRSRNIKVCLAAGITCGAFLVTTVISVVGTVAIIWGIYGVDGPSPPSLTFDVAALACMVIPPIALTAILISIYRQTMRVRLLGIVALLASFCLSLTFTFIAFFCAWL